MLTLMQLRIPTEAARRLVLTGARTAYAHQDEVVVKNTLIGCYGDGTVRPWRLVDHDEGALTVLGWSNGPLQPSTLADRIGVQTEVVEWAMPEAGDTIQLDVVATPVKMVRIGSDEEGFPRPRAILRDVSAIPIGDVRIGACEPASPRQRRAAYADWLKERLSAPRTGLTVTGTPMILDASPKKVGRKTGDGRTRPVLTPYVNAVVSATIVDRGAFGSFLRTGFKKMKDIGFGSVIPREAIDENA